MRVTVTLHLSPLIVGCNFESYKSYPIYRSEHIKMKGLMEPFSVFAQILIPYDIVTQVPSNEPYDIVTQVPSNERI